MAFRSFTVLSILASAVLAQTNPLIPSGISDKCNSYLWSLNNDTAFTACTSPYTTALAQFAPGSSPSADAITTALGSLCRTDAFSGCSQSAITSRLSAFYAACSPELTSSPVEGVKALYDSLYVLWPLRLAVCSKDDGGSYCATKTHNSSSAAGSIAMADSEKSQQQSLLSNYLFIENPSGITTRDVSSSETAFSPNTTTYRKTNLVFLFLQPSMPSSTLCTTCTRNILTPYITFESNCPYAPGLSNSELLAGQVPLYNNITSKCGSSFLSGAVQAAGGLSSGYLSGAAPIAVGQELSAAVGAILGLAAFVAASL